MLNNFGWHKLIYRMLIYVIYSLLQIAKKHVTISIRSESEVIYMVCAKCGALVDDNLSVCDNCGYVFEDNVVQAETDGSEYNINPNTPALPDAFEQPRTKRNFAYNVPIFVIAVIAAAVVLAFAFVGGSYMSDAAIQLSNMQASSPSSIFGFGGGVDGNYYRFIGIGLYGMAHGCRGLGVALASVIVLLGLKKKD